MPLEPFKKKISLSTVHQYRELGTNIDQADSTKPIMNIQYKSESHNYLPGFKNENGLQDFNGARIKNNNQ